jgi:hypothetical protein
LQRAWRKVEEGMVGFVNVKTDYHPRDDRALLQPRNLSRQSGAGGERHSAPPFFPAGREKRQNPQPRSELAQQKSPLYEAFTEPLHRLPAVTAGNFLSLPNLWQGRAKGPQFGGRIFSPACLQHCKS